jgi:hypothetical protein
MSLSDSWRGRADTAETENSRVGSRVNIARNFVPLWSRSRVRDRGKLAVPALVTKATALDLAVRCGDREDRVAIILRRRSCGDRKFHYLCREGGCVLIDTATVSRPGLSNNRADITAADKAALAVIVGSQNTAHPV